MKDLTPSTNKIKKRIYTIRNLQVMLDSDLADFYRVKTKALNQAVKRNSERFPENFMFQISEREFNNLKSQIVTSNRGGRRTRPYAFTEQGVAMLSGVLKSDTAIKISIQIISAFISMRRFIASNGELFHRIESVEKKQVEHDRKFHEIFHSPEFCFRHL